MPLRLSFETGGLAGMHVITAAKTVRIGRDPEQSDIVLTSPQVSRRQAILEQSARGGYTIEIVGNGPSTLNGDPLQGIAMLSSGDRVELGGVELKIAEVEVRVICVMGAAAGREILLGGPVTIGSGGDCDLVINAPGVAAQHLAIIPTPLGFKAEAKAPTSFNGRQAPSRLIGDGDELVVGSVILRVSVTVVGAPADEDETSGSSNIIVSKDLTAVGELVVIAGAAKGGKLSLGDQQILVGTGNDATYLIFDPLASPIHCAISKSGDQFVATDLRSEKGTFVNGTRITKGTELRPGDLLAIGNHVFEARMLGGIKPEKRGQTMFATIQPNMVFGPQPRFVVDGRVVSARKLVFGRAPSCDVTVDDLLCSREHCAIEWSAETASFVVRDTSSNGTYLDDKRVVTHSLSHSCVLRLGNSLFRLTARGEVCTVERSDAALAEAALAVARAQANAVAAQQPGQPAMPQPAVGGRPLKTMFLMDVGQLEHEIQSRKKDLQRGAPAWRPSSDLARTTGLRGAVVLSVIAALAVCGIALATNRGHAMVNHPLSAAHSSEAFAAKASGATVCASCHTAGARVDTGRCASCHTGVAPRPKHHAFDCGRCHKEHVGAAAHTALGANEQCAGCHVGQHAKQFALAGPQRVAAGPLPMKFPVAQLVGHPDDPRIVALHVAHTRVKVGGKDVGIGCTSCHAAAPSPGKLAEFPPGLACYRCHQGGEDPTKLRCEGCHGTEHATTTSTPVAPVVGATGPAIDPVHSIGWAGGLALVGGAPVLLFGLVVRVRRRGRGRKLVAELKAHPAEVLKRLVHSINDSKCVGCGLCVQACPASVLELVDHKSRVVNFDSCIQCKRCENACAFDALRMHDADKPPPMIPMPSIDAFHETPVAGMFLVGQVSGTPQVKNATNLGRAVVQRILQRGYGPGSGRQLGCDVDVAIVGSGPGGLSAALTCIELGLSYVVLEKEREFSWTIRNYYHKGKEVMAEPNDVGLEATLPHWDSTREELLGAWQELVDQNRLDIRYQHNVIDVKKAGERFTIAIGDSKGQQTGQLTAGRVVIAIGTLGNPRKLGCPGDELAKVKNSLVDPDEWTGKSILVVGGSDSAVEVVLSLSQPQRRNRVYFSTRGARLEGIKPKNRKLIEDALAAKQFEMRYATTVAEVTATTVALTFKEDNRREDLPNDVVFAMIGGNSPQKWLQQIGVPYVEKPHSWSPTRTDHLSQKTAEGLVQIRRLPRRALPASKPHH